MGLHFRGDERSYLDAIAFWHAAHTLAGVAGMSM